MCQIDQLRQLAIDGFQYAIPTIHELLGWSVSRDVDGLFVQRSIGFEFFPVQTNEFLHAGEQLFDVSGHRQTSLLELLVLAVDTLSLEVVGSGLQHPSDNTFLF